MQLTHEESFFVAHRNHYRLQLVTMHKTTDFGALNPTWYIHNHNPYT